MTPLDDLLRAGPLPVGEAAALVRLLLPLLEREPSLADPAEIALEGPDGARRPSGRSPGLSAWQAPELARSAPGPEAVVYLAAALAWHAVSGAPPFPADAPPEALAVRKLLERPAPLPEQVPQALGAALGAALSPDRARRPSLAELKQALEAIASEQDRTAARARFSSPTPPPREEAPPTGEQIVERTRRSPLRYSLGLDEDLAPKPIPAPQSSAVEAPRPEVEPAARWAPVARRVAMARRAPVEAPSAKEAPPAAPPAAPSAPPPRPSPPPRLSPPRPMVRSSPDLFARATPTGRRVKGPDSDLVELRADDGAVLTAIVFHPPYREHRAINEALAPLQGFLEAPMVQGLPELVCRDRAQGAFVYATGPSRSVAELVTALADLGDRAGVRAALELLAGAASVLHEAGQAGAGLGRVSHLGLSPWRVLLGPGGAVLIVGDGLPPMDLLCFAEDPGHIPREDSFRYSPPERIEGAAEDPSSDLYALALIAFELVTGKPVFDGLLNDIRQQAARGEGARRLYRHRDAIPAGLGQLLRTALRPGRQDRHPSTLAFLEDASALLAGEERQGPSLAELTSRLWPELRLAGTTASLRPAPAPAPVATPPPLVAMPAPVASIPPEQAPVSAAPPLPPVQGAPGSAAPGARSELWTGQVARPVPLAPPRPSPSPAPTPRSVDPVVARPPPMLVSSMAEDSERSPARSTHWVIAGCGGALALSGVLAAALGVGWAVLGSPEARWPLWAAGALAASLVLLGGLGLVVAVVSRPRRARRVESSLPTPVSTIAPPIVTAPPPAIEDDAPEPGFQPFQIGPYRCFGRVGEGGMGVVYRARHQGLGRLSAVKVLPPHVAMQPMNLAWFQREARLAARIQHPNVVGVYDCGTLDGSLHYLAMELVPGAPLKRWIQPGGVALPMARAVLPQLADGLDAAHAGGIIHRDLKPDNILVHEERGRWGLKIVDFGIARPRGEQSETAGAVIVGTAPYMSPEQARGEPDLDARSDIFSLGVVAYEMLTGTLPFGRLTDRYIQAVYARGHLSDPPPPVGERRPNLSPRVDRVLARALSPERERRHGSARELASELVAALGPR